MSSADHGFPKGERFAVTRRELLRLIGGGAGLVVANRFLPISTAIATPVAQAATLVVAANVTALLPMTYQNENEL